jgi:hypothetical protein
MRGRDDIRYVILVKDKVWAAGLAALPAVEVSLLLYAFFRRSLLDHIPGVINDAVDYWLEARAFAYAGFQGGYFTIDERPAPASFSHFGSHGPFFPMLHGTLARLFGWHPYSIPLFHLGFVTAALLIFARHVSLDGRCRALTALSLATFWPLLLLLPTSLQEGLHLAVAVWLATAFRALLDGREASRTMRASLIVILSMATLMRPSWGLLLVPAFMLLLGDVAWRRQVLAAVAGLVLWATLIAAFAYVAAPFGQEEFFFVRIARFQEGASALLTHAAANASRFTEAGSALEVRNRFLVLGLALSTGALAWFARPRHELVFHAYNLGSIFLASLFTYLFGNWGDYRVFSAHLLLTTLLLASSRAPVALGLAAVALLAQLGSVGPFIEVFPELRDTYRYNRARMRAFRVAARGVLVFEARQDAWCNTLVSVNSPYFYRHMIGLPPGMGVTMLFGSGGAPRPPLRSRYVLLDPDPDRWSMGTPTVTLIGPEHVHVGVGDWLSLDLKPLVPTFVGQLYENLDARCPGP